MSRRLGIGPDVELMRAEMGNALAFSKHTAAESLQLISGLDSARVTIALEHLPTETSRRSDLGHVLESIRRITSATETVLIQRDSARDRLVVVASATSEVDRSIEALSNTHLPYHGEVRKVEYGTSNTCVSGLLAGLSAPGEDASRIALLLTFAKAGDVSSVMIDRTIPAVVTVLRTHLSMQARVQSAQRAHGAAMAAFHQNECGVFVLRENRTIVLCNAAADAILAANAGLTLSSGTLRPTEYHDAVRFHTAVDCVIDKTATSGFARRCGVIMLLAQPRHGRPLIAVITPVLQPEPGEAAAIVYVLSPDQNIVRGINPICLAHGLSPVEARLVTHLVSGFSVNEAAADMRIKPATARTYLKQIFAKTNTHRQVDLVQLFTRYLRAVRGDFDFTAG